MGFGRRARSRRGICQSLSRIRTEGKACLPKVVAVKRGSYPDWETCIPAYESGLFNAPDCLSGHHFSGIMYKNPLFLYTVFRKPSYCPDFHQSGRFAWRWLYNNGQFPGANVWAGCGTGGANQRKGCFGGADRIFFSRVHCWIPGQW
jgi:hypothetical protein